MILTPGTRLGPYEIQSALGAGGMGEVYKARDTRLERTVAIKVLPEYVAANPEVKQRFEREAKALAALSHAHICPIHDVGTQDGIDYLVMEYLAGETLEQRLKRGALQLEQALQVAVQIADALAAAHRAGIVHRDLKPGNIMLTKSDRQGSPQARLLDFGLAKTGAQAVAGSVSMLPTTPPNLTAHGTILGTFQYMAPEQLEGHDADARTDIFAFGSLLYEMITGQRAFEGKSQASLIAAILDHEPAPISTAQPLAPSALNQLVTRCLAKAPDERWQSAADLRAQLRWIADQELSVKGEGASRERGRSGRERLAWGLVVVLSIGAAAMAGLRGGQPVPVDATATVRFTVQPADGTTLFSGDAGPYGSVVSISPDGRRLAFLAVDANGTRHLWIRPLDGLAAQRLAGTDGASGPFWSPDSTTIAFFADNKLKRVAATGGDVFTICEAGLGGGGTWNQDNIIVFNPSDAGEGGLYRVPANGGTPVAVTSLDATRGETNHLWPRFLPDGDHYLFYLSAREQRDSGIYVASLASGARALLIEEAALDGQYSMSAYGLGYLLFFRGRTLMAQAFDVDTRSLSGPVLRVADNVSSAGPGSSAFSISTMGTLVFWTGKPPQSMHLTWVRRDGTPDGTIGSAMPIWSVRLSPDEQRVAVEQYDPIAKTWSQAIWLLGTVRTTATKMTGEWGAGSPVWSVDGTRFAYASGRRGPPSIYSMAADGTGEETLVLRGTASTTPYDWSPDGKTLVYGRYSAATTKWDLLALTPGSEQPQTFLQTPVDEYLARVSPDGRWLAFVTNETGQAEVRVTTFPKAGAVWPVSVGRGTQPEWRRDGRELFYRAGDGALMAVDIAAGSVFSAATPRRLFAFPLGKEERFIDTTSYAVSAGGRRFLVEMPAGEPVQPPIVIVMNFAAALQN